MKAYLALIPILLTLSCSSNTGPVIGAWSLDDGLGVDSKRPEPEKQGACVFDMASSCIELDTKNAENVCLETYRGNVWLPRDWCNIKCTTGGCLVGGNITWHYAFPGGYSDPSDAGCPGPSSAVRAGCEAQRGFFIP